MSTRILAGRYELQEKIGDGGMAVVYKARCRLLNRYVAIKILKPEFAGNLKFIENFKKESQAAASLSHPNIVSIYDVGREGNIHYIVMELIEGYILSDLIASEGPLEWRRSVEIAMQIASALSFAHKNHIIHRDVKPHNILITKDGTAKITDFGIAKAINSSTIGEETKTIMGSVHYFSPEQARGGYVDEKSDIYSLGIVLYEMLTGKVPFDGENPVAVALMHINEEMKKPTLLKDDIPTAIEDVVMKATEKFQVSRYASADEMYEALRNAEFAIMLEGGAPKHEVHEKEGEEDQGEELRRDKEGEIPMTKGKRFRINKAKIIALILALVCAVPLSIFIAGLLGEAGESEEFDTPDFRGMTFDAAKLAAAEFGLEIKMGDTVYSADYNEDTISSQIPDVNSKVKEGKTITVNISKGMKEGTVPNIVGKSKNDASFALTKYGFKEGSITYQKSNTLPKGIVISQTPGAGEEATPGSYVTFVVSEGVDENETVMPLLTGTSLEEARLKLAEAGLSVGNITYEKSETYEEDQVIWQSHEASKAITSGSAIDLKVSSGNREVDPQTPSTPTVPTIYVDYSAAENPVFWLTVTISDESGTHNIITRAQRIKDDGGESVALQGTGKGSVTVIFDNTVVAEYSADFNTGVLN